MSNENQGKMTRKPASSPLSREDSRKKSQYSTPTLLRYGALDNLTQGGASGTSDHGNNSMRP
jgi:hypothetical protein